MTQERIYTITKPSEGFFKDRGSKFYAFAFPVNNVAEVDPLIKGVKKEYHDARHHCTAYRIGKKGETIYTNDDGEPGNSAGPPILAAIRSAALTNVLIVVVRYFGGTKLGIRGLIEAYRTAAEKAIQAAKEANAYLEIIAKTTFTLYFPYTQTSEVNRILHRHEVEEVKSEYTDTCKLTLSIREENYAALETQIISSGIEIRPEEAL